MEAVVVLDMLAVLIGTSVAGARGAFALGRDHRLPAVLGRVSGRRIPHVASGVLLAFYALVIVLTLAWDGLFAQEGLPHYVAIFTWGATFGGFALGVIYLLMSIGAVRGLADHPKRWAVYLAAAAGVAVTAAAIFGSVYQVAAPTIYAVYAAIATLIVGLVLAFVSPPTATAGTRFRELTEAEQGPSSSSRRTPLIQLILQLWRNY
jgi:amino acid transporter